jgi:hypothetical protein
VATIADIPPNLEFKGWGFNALSLG